MKTNQKGFVVPLLILIVAILVVGGGVYFYFTNSSRSNYDERLSVLGSKGISSMLSQGGDDSIGIQKEISKRILNESGDTRERVSLARILGESNTPEALATLTKVVLTTKNSELYRITLEQMNWMGSTNSEQQIKQMTKIAIDSWRMVAQSSKPMLYYVFANILAKLGDPEGIAFLRAEAIKGGVTISELNRSENTPAMVAMQASKGFSGPLQPESVSLLAESLKVNDPNSTEFVWSGQALSAAGFKDGASALIEWSKNAPDSCAELAGVWLGGFNDSHSVSVILELGTSGDSTQFKSQKVKAAVFKNVAKFQALYAQYDSPDKGTADEVKITSLSGEQILSILHACQNNSTSPKFTKTIDGKYSCNDSGVGTTTVDLIARGNIGGGGVEEDVAFRITTCAKTCINKIGIILNNGTLTNGYVVVYASDLIGSQTNQADIVNLRIHDGLLAVTARGFKPDPKNTQITSEAVIEKDYTVSSSVLSYAGNYKIISSK